MIEAKRWWEDGIMVLLAVQCNYGEDSFEILKTHAAKKHFSGEQLLHLTAKGHQGCYNEDKDGEKLDRYLKESRKAGLREIIYLNIHMDFRELYSGHPEYFQIKKSGGPIGAYGAYYALTCVNGPSGDRYVDAVKKLCRHGIDGIFLDGPVSVAQGGCYCESCIEKFYERYGKNLHDALPQELQRFRIDSSAGFVKRVMEAVKSVNSDILLYNNNDLLHPYHNMQSRSLAAYNDLIGTEAGFIKSVKGTTLWHISAPLKMAQTIAGGKPVMCFLAGNQSDVAYYMHTACDTNIFYAQAIANGANIWYGVHGPSEQMNTPGGMAAAAFNEFIEKNKAYLVKTKTNNRAALLWSDDTANYYYSTAKETDASAEAFSGKIGKTKSDHYRAFMGFFDMLSRGHVQFDVLDEFSVKQGGLKNYDVLILPTCACMSEDTASFISEYVSGGGSLVSSFDTGLYDENGGKRNKSVIADIQGVSGFEGIEVYEDYGCGYKIADDNNFISEGVTNKHIPLAKLALKVTPQDETEVLVKATVSMHGKYASLPDKATFPSVLRHCYGKGESIFFTDTIGEGFEERAYADYKRMALNAVHQLSAPLFTTDAPESVEMVLREQDNRYILHLINLTGEMTLPRERIIPINNIHIKINVDKAVNSVTTLTDEQHITFDNSEKCCEFTLPCLKEHELIIIEKES